jgi:membrane fusion protein (multidrug efflux system)
MTMGRPSLCPLFAFLLLGACKHEGGPTPPPPPEVHVAQVLQRDQPVYVEAIGQTRGSTEVEIRSRVEGFVETVDYREGSFVEPGQLLYTIDPRPFEAELARALASKAVAEADLARARQDVVRYEPLVEKNAISRQEYETAVALERAAVAAVEATEAVVRSAEIDLGFTRILAPGRGLAGKTEVFPGALVQRGLGTPLTQISQIDPIHVRITIAERDYLRFARRRAQADPDRPETSFELLLADGSVHPHPGSLVFVDRNVDPRTGTILLELSFPNSDGLVRPGQYARVRAVVETRQGAILVPQRSVQELQGIHQVAVVDAKGVVEIRAVQAGERAGTLWVIDSGLRPEDRVVVEGLQKVRPGLQVAAKEVPIEEQPAARAGAGAPAPADAPAEK